MIASLISLNAEFGKFKIFSITVLLILFPTAGGIGNITSKRHGRASPSLPLMFDKNKLGENNAEFNSERSQFEETLSTAFSFREDSILAETQRLLDSIPTNGGEARSHVANVIDQTSRYFKDGNIKISYDTYNKNIEKERKNFMVQVNHTQSVAVLIDGNNIGMSINSAYGQSAMLNFDSVVPKILNGRGLNRLVYLREGKHISEKFAERLRRNFFGIVMPCMKSSDIPLTIQAVKLAEKVDTIVIFSGDSDYCELVDYLKGTGVRVEIVAMKDSASKYLLERADGHYFLTKEDIFELSS